MTFQTIIIEAVNAMDETTAKKELASILLNCKKTGKEGYSNKDFRTYCEHRKNEIVVNHSFDIK